MTGLQLGDVVRFTNRRHRAVYVGVVIATNLHGTDIARIAFRRRNGKPASDTARASRVELVDELPDRPAVLSCMTCTEAIGYAPQSDRVEHVAPPRWGDHPPAMLDGEQVTEALRIDYRRLRAAAEAGR